MALEKYPTITPSRPISYRPAVEPTTSTGSPIRYTNPIQSLRTGGDVTNINAFGEGTPFENITKRAQSLYESDSAKRLATYLPAMQRYGATAQDAYKMLMGSPEESFQLRKEWGQKADESARNVMGMYGGMREVQPWEMRGGSNSPFFKWGQQGSMGSVNPFTGNILTFSKNPSASWASPGNW